MTTQELKNEVSALCRVDIPEKDKRFFSIANLALSTVCRECGIRGSYRLYCSGNTALSFRERVVHRGLSEEKLSLSGRAFSMVVSGTGCVRVSDVSGARLYDFDDERRTIRGYIEEGASVTLLGRLGFTVYNLATFADRYSDSEEDIPVLDGERVVDMRRSVADFGGFICAPTDEYGNPVPQIKMSDGRLYIDGDYTGELTLLYRRIPKRIYADAPHAEIDAPKEYLPLLPLLCSYYVASESDESGAQYFKRLYDDMLKTLKSTSTELFDNRYIDTRGWV